MRISLFLTAGILSLTFAAPASQAQNAVDDSNDWTAASHKIRPVLTPTVDTSTPTRPMQSPSAMTPVVPIDASEAPVPSVDDEAPKPQANAEPVPPQPALPNAGNADKQAVPAGTTQPLSATASQAIQNILQAQQAQNAAATAAAQPNVPYPPSFQAQQAQEMQYNQNPVNMVPNGYGRPNNVLILNNH